MEARFKEEVAARDPQPSRWWVAVVLLLTAFALAGPGPALGRQKAPSPPAEPNRLSPWLRPAQLEQTPLFTEERFPNVVVTGQGTVVATFGSRSVRVRRSLDGGQSWGPMTPLADPGFQTGGMIVDRESGDLLAFVEASHPPAEAMMYRSRDDGATWQREVFQVTPNSLGHTPSLHMNEHGITLTQGPHRGRLIRPSRYYAGANAREKWPEHYTNAIFSDDHGKSWQASEPFPARGTGEAAIAELADGTLYYNSRRHWAPEGENPRRRWTARSADGGATWIDLKICEALPDGPQDRDYGCMGGLTRLPLTDRDILLYSNCDSPGGRHHGTVWVSFDGGQTWPVKRLLETGAFAYSSLAAGCPDTPSDGWIFLHYEGGDGGASSIARFNLRWVLEGTPTGDGSVPEWVNPPVTEVPTQNPTAHPLSFRLRRLAVDANEGIAAGDVDGDGAADLVSGRFWFRGPDWSPRPLRLIEDWNGYVQSNGDFLWDVDGDDRLDVIAGSFLPTEVHWYRNPGPEALRRGQLWPRQLLVDTRQSTNEGQMLHDLDGDGRPEWIVDSWTKNVPAFVYRFEPVDPPPEDQGEPRYRVVPHTLGERGNGHGLGVGDLNGDGRTDVLFGQGWYEQPDSDPWQQPWTFHPDWDLHASLPMLVVDVDRDGRLDLIYGNGHDYGLYWWRNEAGGNGEPLRWKPHLIDDRFSQPHTLAWTDLDGDGHGELITGKRYYAHNGNDPGGQEAPCLYYYAWDPEKEQFQRHPIDEGEAGCGLQIVAQDLNGDGRCDIAVAGKSGTYVFEQVSGTGENPESRAAQ